MQVIKAPAGDPAGSPTRHIRETVEQIIDRVQSKGRQAVRDYTRHFDRYQGPLIVGPDDIDAKRRDMNPKLEKALETAMKHIRRFHQHQKACFCDQEWTVERGVTAGIRFVPVERVGVYVPAGRYPLISTLMMGVIPAQVAGVANIVVISPPSTPQGVDPAILGLAGMLGLQDVWAVGGAQAIALAAFGADGIQPVDMVIGPGNAYVTEAKRILFGQVGIDGIAGPSEVLIIADESADPELIAKDLIAQAEHDTLSVCRLFCTTTALANEVAAVLDGLLAVHPQRDTPRSAWHAQGSIICGGLDEAVAYANQTAPEHLQLMVKHPAAMLKRCNSYGSAFLGPHSTVAFGDFVTGTNHILPTGRAARYSGGVWIGTFLKPLTHQRFDTSPTPTLTESAVTIAEQEGLSAHADAIRARSEASGGCT